MKNNLLLKTLLVFISLSFISLSSQSKCSFTALCYNSQGTLGNAYMPPGLNISINQGDTITMAASSDMNCQVIWSGWYYNGNLIATPTNNSNNTIYLSIAPQPGTYTAQISYCAACMVFMPVTFNIYFTTTAINEINYLSQLNLHPVPANNNLTISLSSLKESEYTFTFTNALGSVVKEYTLQHVSGDIKQEEDLTALTDGVYFLIIHNKDMKETRRFLKIRE